MKLTIPNDADYVQLEITAPHKPNRLAVKVDGVITSFDYANSTVTLTDLKQGQLVEVYEETSHTIEGEAPVEVSTFPTLTRIKFRINSLDHLPEAEVSDAV